MQSQEEVKLEQAAPEDGAATSSEDAPKRRGRPPGSKNKKKKVSGKKKTSKKKTSKKKVSKKKSTKKKATKKKASKKKASKKKAAKKKVGRKKRSSKKTGGAASQAEPMSRLLAAVDELREAALELAQSRSEDHQTVVSDLRKAAQSRISEIEQAAVRSLKRFGW